MKAQESNIFFAKNLNDLFYQLKTIANLKIIGSCTGSKEMPQKAISTRLIKELCLIHKHERYIDFGPGTTLSEILETGERNIAKILYEACLSVANPFVRNIATIGGNLLTPSKKTSLYAPLLALDTSLEFKTPSETIYIPLRNFTEIPEKFVLTNIRIPENDWDVEIFRRLGPKNSITEDSASFAFLADSEKSVITNLRIAFSGTITFRCQQLENKMLGTKLPLAHKDIDSYVQEAVLQFEKSAGKTEYNPILEHQFENLTRYSFEQLT